MTFRSSRSWYNCGVSAHTQTAEKLSPVRERITTVDQFRGLAIFTMVIANFIGGVGWVPAWLKHAPDVGFTVIDQIAPFFVFAIALNFRPSLERRIDRSSKTEAYLHFFVRGMAVMGIGFVFSLGEQWTGYSSTAVSWGVLQALGMAMVLNLPVLRLRWYVRLIIAFAMLAAYQFCLDNYWLKEVLASSHGGVLGGFSWTAMLMLSTVLFDLFSAGEKKTLFLIAGFGFIVGGLALSSWFPISKNRVSPAYVLFSTGVSTVFYAGFHFLNDIRRVAIPLLSAWGRNPIAFYVLHQILLAFFVFPASFFSGPDFWFAQAPWWLTIVQVAAFLCLLSWIALRLDRRKIYLKF